MKSLLYVSVRTRLYGLLGMLAALVLVVSAIGLYSAHVVSGQMRALHEEELVPQKYISIIASRTRDVALAVDKAIIAGDRRSKVNARASIRMHRDELLQAWESYQEVPKSAEEEALANKVWSGRTEIARIDDLIFEAFAAGNMEEARRLRTHELDAAMLGFSEAADQLITMLQEHADELTVESQATYERNRTIVIGMILFAMAGGSFLAMLLARSIMNSLATAVDVSRRIAEGQLGHQIEVKGHDELADLLGSLKTMDQRLNEVVGDVREAANAVGSASDQLSRGNDDLSQRTQEQASALEETAASMEEMNSTVKQNADNAQQAERLAREARNQAESGSAEVQRTIQAMQEINNSSRKISDIIGVIDEIAFQTNLLALNAAVEAARAGEQGRGFAVVATEVRNLAQRSAAAAKETKELINESLAKVRAGSEIVDGSGRTLGEIMESVKKVSDIVSEIAAASSEQASGVNQVNNAVSQMDETTQQNAALVEEAAAASKTLQQQAQQLMTSMSFFKVEGSQAPARARTAAVIPLPSSDSKSHRPTPVRKPVARPRPAPAPRVSKASGDDAWTEF